MDEPETTRPDLVPQPRALPPVVERLLSIAVVPGDDAATIRSKRLLAGALAVSLFTGSISASLDFRSGATLAAIAISLTLITALGSLVAMWWRPANYPGVMHFVIAATLVASGAVTVMFGGIAESGASTVWGVITILGAVVIFADRRATFWLIAFVISTLVAVWWGEHTDPIYTLENPRNSLLFNLLVVLVFVYTVMYFYVRISARLQSQSDALLRNILPAQIADRLKVAGGRIAEEFESASILFADAAGFTPMSAGMSSNELIEVLDEVFTCFDELVADRGLEKIKTIGDAYMAAAGVPVRRDDHAQAICDLALAMQEELAGRAFQGRRLQFRIGIASGPVVGGIIGRTKFSYDLWGDTVNTASRMESTGAPGRIQITTTTYSLVRDEFTCEPKGTFEVKGKGLMEVWYLMGRTAGSGRGLGPLPDPSPAPG